MALVKQLCRLGTLAGSGGAVGARGLQALGAREDTPNAALLPSTIHTHAYSGRAIFQRAGGVGPQSAPEQGSKRFYAASTSFSGAEGAVLLCNRVFKSLPSRIILVRAAETLVPGPSAQRGEGEEPPLSAKGVEQAEAAAARVIGLAAQASSSPQIFIYSSPLRRAMDTAEAIRDLVVDSIGDEAVIGKV